MSAPPHRAGGPVAIRGFLVQTLVALLDAVTAEPPFTEITLEPASRRNEAHSERPDDAGEKREGSQSLLTSAATEMESCRAVSERAAQTLKWAEQNKLSLLTIALDHLTLGRAALYAAILERSAALRAAATPNNPTAADSSDAFLPAEAAAGHRPALQALQTARRELDAAVAGLRRDGQQFPLVTSLLTRAWLRFLTGAHTGPESAQEDVDEAWEIAERGPMKLFLADIHLYRARLFGMSNDEFRTANKELKYPWGSPAADLAAAEKIIRHETAYKNPDGKEITARYARRDVELTDAKQATLGE